MFGIRKTLTAAKIAAPTRILADLVAFRIAQLPAHGTGGIYHANDGKLELKLSDGRVLFVWKKDLWMHVTYANADPDESGRIAIEFPGEKDERSRHVKLTDAEAWPIIREIRKYQKRCVDLHTLGREEENQSDALDIVERLI